VGRRGRVCDGCKAAKRRLRDLHHSLVGRDGRASVRCLGPGPEHTFCSPDPSRVRVCQRCRDRLDRQHYSPRCENVAFDLTRDR